MDPVPRAHRRRAVDDVRAELDDDGRRTGVTTAALLAENGHRAAIVRPASDHVANDVAQDAGAVRVEELDREAHHRADVSAGVDPPREKLLDLRHLDAEAVAALQVPSPSLLLQDRLAVLWQLDGLVSSPGARMAGDLGASVEKTDRAVVGDERERAARVHGRHGVAVRVDPHEGGLVDVDRYDRGDLG